MNLRLLRNKAVLYGIFGVLLDENAKEVAVTLEHAYSDGTGGFIPRVPAGEYTCVRGQHRLDGMTNTFETFEITGVPGHTNILFHKGNYNTDSAGCVLLGSELGPRCILESAMAFGHFLDLQAGCDSFQLTVQ